MVSILQPQIEPSASIEFRPEEELSSRAGRLASPLTSLPKTIVEEEEGKRQLQITREIQKKQAQEKLPPISTIDDLLQGKTTRIGENEVDLFLLESAKQGDKKAITDLRNQIAIATGDQYFLNTQKAKTPVIAGVDITLT